MADIAARGGIAKATLYNSLRTKDDVLAELIRHDAAAAIDDALSVRHDPTKALARLAWRVGTHPVIRGALAAEPELAAAVVSPRGDHAIWTDLRAQLTGMLTALGIPVDDAARDVTLTWLLGIAVNPPHDPEGTVLIAQAQRVLGGLTGGVAVADGLAEAHAEG